MRRAVVLALTLALLAPASAGAAIRRVALPGGPSALAAIPGGIAVVSQAPMLLSRVSWGGSLITQQRLPIDCSDAIVPDAGPLFVQLAAEGSSLALVVVPNEASNEGHGVLVRIDGAQMQMLSCGPYDPGFEPLVVGDGEQVVERLAWYSPGCDSDSCEEVLTLLDPITNTVFGTSYTWSALGTTSCAGGGVAAALMAGTLYGVTRLARPYACRLDGTPVWMDASFGSRYRGPSSWDAAVGPAALVVAFPAANEFRVYDPRTGAPRAALPNVGQNLRGLAVMGDTVAWIANGSVYVRPLDGHVGRRVLAHLPRTITPTGLIATPQGLAWTGMWYWHSHGALWLASAADVKRALR
jgi:hypothetical protein